MLWEAATREKMWRGLRDATIMNRVINGEIPRPSDDNGKVPPELERIVLKALSPEREARQASARDLQLELDAFRAKLEEAGPRELGPLLGELFKTERERQRRTIEEQLGAEQLGRALESRGSEDATPSNYALSERSGARRPGRPLRRTGIVALVVLASAALAVFVLLTKPEPPPSPAPPGSGTTAKAAETIEVRIRAAPSSAVISIDGVPAPKNPALLFVDPDDSLHEVRANAEGYEEAVESVRFDRNRTLVLRLSKHVASPVPSALASSAPGAMAPKAPKAHERERARPVPNDCDPPFTIDERGIKRFKPSCVR
jgi:serine/threonine-protein kinase